MVNEENKSCKNFTIYTEDFCVSFGQNGEKCGCTNCFAFSDFIEWLEDKNPKKKPLIDF